MFELNLSKAWPDAILKRSSVRRYTGAPTKEQLDELGKLCRKISWQGITVRMFKGPGLKNSIKGTDVYAVIVAKQGTAPELEGYMGEALVLEATAMGLGTCWLGAGFYADVIGRNVNLQNDEAVHCVIAIGQAQLPTPAPKRRSIEQLTGKSEADIAAIGQWQAEAVRLARLAPSAINQQPWHFTVDSTSVSILERGVLINKYSGIDRGICMLHAAVGASKAGRNPSWKKVDLGYELHA